MRKKQLRYVILAVIAGSTMMMPAMANDSGNARSSQSYSILVDAKAHTMETVTGSKKISANVDEAFETRGNKVNITKSTNAAGEMSINVGESHTDQGTVEDWGPTMGIITDGRDATDNYLGLVNGTTHRAYAVNYNVNGANAKYNLVEVFSGNNQDEIAAVQGAKNAEENVVILRNVGSINTVSGVVLYNNKFNEVGKASKNTVFVAGGQDIGGITGALAYDEKSSSGSLENNLVVLASGTSRSASGAVANVSSSGAMTPQNIKTTEVIGNRVFLGIDSADTEHGKIYEAANRIDSNELKKRMGKSESDTIVPAKIAQIIGGASETNKANKNIVIIGEGSIIGKGLLKVNDETSKHHVNGIDTNSFKQDPSEAEQENNNYIIGGVSDVEATGNIVDINNAKALASGKVGIWGGHYFSDNATGDIKTGNTLNLNKVKGITLSRLANFENYNFDLPKDVVNGDIILTVTDPNGTDVSNTKINVGVSGEAPALHTGDAIKLIYNTNGVTTTGAQYGKLQQGASLAYDITAKAGDDAKSVIAVIKENSTENTPNPTQPTTGGSVNPATPSTGDTAGTTPANGGTAGTTPTNDGTTGTTPANGGTVGTTPANGGTTGTPAAGTTTPSTGTVAGSVLPQTKSFVETRTAVSSVINNGQDSIVKAFANTSSTAPIVAGVSHGRMRVESGSYANINGTNIVLGLGKQAGKTYWGPFVEMGWSRYDSHLDSGLRADGNAKYYGVGVYGKTTYDNGMYLEGSIRGGRTSYNYESNEIKTATKTVHTSYDAHNMYYAAHVGLGKVVSYGNGYEGTVYGNLFYSHQGEATATLKGEGLGETYTFAGVNSLRTRLGYKVSKQLGNSYTGYVGAAYEHEFSGEAHATVKGASTLAPSLGGSSGLVEVGVTYGSTADTFTGTLNVEGWFGQKRGTTFGGRVNWKY